MTIKIKMFTKTVCPTCKIAKQQLSFLPVPVEIEEINIETSEEEFDIVEIRGCGDIVEKRKGNALEYLTTNLDSMSTPTFEFEDGHVIRGFEMGQLMEKLGL
ncbi:hypothetical protein BMBphi_gp005 [Bacillus phage vB_BthS_BMBphi]|nr:hypothetical protein BMBphi_gp005 [Bacillus phage vB_BthS_BMBphi]